MADSLKHQWGRVDESGTVYVFESEGERVVGQYPDGSPEEALAYYERKYTDLEAQVRLAEQRSRGGASAQDIRRTVSALRDALTDAAAVGDLAALSERLNALESALEQLSAEQKQAAQEATAAALAERTAIVEEIERLAATDPAKAQWKTVTARVDALFTQWQQHQREAPRLGKAEANDLWKRFREARSIIERERKSFFTDLESQHRDAKNRKTKLVEEAEALASKGADGVPAYRSLLEQWKKSGRAGKRADDALWARFKAAGDVLYGAKAEIDAQTNAEFAENLRLKRELLNEAEPLTNEKDHVKARAALTEIQKRWDAIGRVPRDNVREVEDRMRKIESSVRQREEDHWRRNDPEKRARSESMERQLNDAIAQLEDELATAQKSGDERRISAAQDALDARRAWLKALS